MTVTQAAEMRDTQAVAANGEVHHLQSDGCHQQRRLLLTTVVLYLMQQVSAGCFELRDGPDQLNSFSKWLPAYANLVTGLVIQDSRFAAVTEDRGEWEAGLVSVLSRLPGLQSLTMRSPDSRYASVSDNDGDYSGNCYAPAYEKNSNASYSDSDSESESGAESDSLSAHGVLACISSMSQLTYLEAGVLAPHGTFDESKRPDTTLPASVVTTKLTYKMHRGDFEQVIAKDSRHKYAHLGVVDMRGLPDLQSLDITMLKGDEYSWGEYFPDGGAVLIQNPALHLTRLSLRGRVIEVDSLPSWEYAFPELLVFECTLDPPCSGGHSRGGYEAMYVDELADMIRVMPKLERLHVHGLYKSYQGLKQDDLQRVLKAIAPAKALTYLQLPNLQSAAGRVEPGTVGVFLQQLTCLRQLDIAIEPLTQQDILPLAGLCELTALTVRGLSYTEQDVRALQKRCSSITQLQQCTVVQL